MKTSIAVLLSALLTGIPIPFLDAHAGHGSTYESPKEAIDYCRNRYGEASGTCVSNHYQPTDGAIPKLWRGDGSKAYPGDLKRDGEGASINRSGRDLRSQGETGNFLTFIKQFNNGYSLNLYGQNIVAEVSGKTHVALNNNELKVKTNSVANLRELQSKIGAILSYRFDIYEECGNRFRISSVSLSASRYGAYLEINANAALWYCTYADVLQFRDLRTYWKSTRTSKSRVAKGSGRITTTIVPQIQNHRNLVFVEQAPSISFSGELLGVLPFKGNFSIQNVMGEILGEYRYALEQMVVACLTPYVNQYGRFTSAEFRRSINGELELRGEVTIDIPSRHAERVFKECERYSEGLQ